MDITVLRHIFPHNEDKLPLVGPVLAPALHILIFLLWLVQLGCRACMPIPLMHLWDNVASSYVHMLDLGVGVLLFLRMQVSHKDMCLHEDVV